MWAKAPRNQDFSRWLSFYKKDEKIQKAVKSLQYMTAEQYKLYEKSLFMKEQWGHSAKPTTLLKYVERMLTATGKDPGSAPGIIAAALGGARNDTMGYIVSAIKYIEKYKAPWEEEAGKRAVKRFHKYISDPSSIPDDIAALNIPNDEKIVEAYKREAHDFGQPGRVDSAIAWWNNKYSEIIKHVPDNTLATVLGLTSGQAAQNIGTIRSARLIKEPYDEDNTKKMALFKSVGFNMHQQRVYFGLMKKVLKYVAHLATLPPGDKAGDWARQFGVTADEFDVKGSPNFLMVEMVFPYAYGISQKYVRIAKKNVGVKIVSKEQLGGDEGSFDLEDPSLEKVRSTLMSARFYKFIALAITAGKDMD